MEKLNNMFYGTYMIIPGQYQLLDNQFISFDKQNLRVIVRGGKDTIYSYSVNETDQLYYKGAPLKAVKVRLDSMNATHADGPNNLTNLFNIVLGMKTPTTIYISYDNQTGLYTLKNSQYSNIFILRKTSDTYQSRSF